MSSQTPSESDIKRLAYIKYLYMQGIYQSGQPEPMAVSSILSFHDAVEFFLRLCCELNAINSDDASFMGYFGLLKQKKKVELSHQESMRRLNKSRVNLKHHGIMPSKLDIEDYRAITTSFFRDNTPMVFGVDFDSISLVHLVRCENARKELEDGQAIIAEGLFYDATIRISHAFDLLLKDFEKRNANFMNSHPFFLGEDIEFPRLFAQESEEKELVTFLEQVSNSIMAIKQAVKIISLGIDYQRYSKFRLVAPFVSKNSDGFYYCQRSEALETSKEDSQFCMDFVIECALKLQEFDLAYIGEQHIKFMQ